MRWNKRGRINLDSYEDGKFVTRFATLPTPILLSEDVIRIFIGFCDDGNVGRIGYVDVAANNPSHVFGVSNKAVLDIGRPGCFDDNGVVPLSILRVGDDIYLYYVGFQMGVKIPYFMFGGLAVSKDGGKSFKRFSETPILDRTGEEVFARCGMNVIKDKDGYKMWYVGTTREGWTLNGDVLKPLYIMRYIESEDGIHWTTDSVQCLEYGNEDEHGFGRPFVWKENGCYRMMYSIRTYSRGYYIGYAESNDGKNWIRKDELAGIQLSENGWDDINISYPYILRTTEKTYLFYNGNGCGKSGFGYAELEI